MQRRAGEIYYAGTIMCTLQQECWSILKYLEAIEAEDNM